MAFIRGANVVTDGLVLTVDAANSKSYPGSGTTWRDLGGSSRNATINNSPSYSASPIPLFDFTTNPAGTISSGVNQNIVFPNTVVPTSGSFSVEMWMNRDFVSIPLGDRESLFSSTGGSDGFRIQISVSTGFTGSLYYLIGGVGGVGYSENFIGSGYNIADGSWHQVTAVFDRSAQLGSYSVYAHVDGILKGSRSISSGNEAFTANFPGISLGCCSKYKGKMSKLTVYNRALSAQEVLQNYNATKARFGL